MINKLKAKWEQLLVWIGNEKAVLRAKEAAEVARLEAVKAKLAAEAKTELEEIDAAFKRHTTKP